MDIARGVPAVSWVTNPLGAPVPAPVGRWFACFYTRDAASVCASASTSASSASATTTRG